MVTKIWVFKHKIVGQYSRALERSGPKSQMSGAVSGSRKKTSGAAERGAGGRGAG